VPVRATARRSLCTRSRIVGDPTTEISTADVLVYGCSAELMGSVFFLVLEECYGSNNSCCFSHVGSQSLLDVLENTVHFYESNGPQLIMILCSFKYHYVLF
jgi:hypothetical protein